MQFAWLIGGVVVLVGVVVGWLPLAWGFVGVGSLVMAAWAELGATINQHAQLLEREQRLYAELRARATAPATPAPSPVNDPLTAVRDRRVPADR